MMNMTDRDNDEIHGKREGEKVVDIEAIIKAYKFCKNNEGTCDKCSYFPKKSELFGCPINKDMISAISEQKAEIDRLKAEKETIIKKLKYMIETRSRVLENKSDLMDLIHYKGQSYADRREGKVVGLMLALEIVEGKDGIALDRALKDGEQE